MRGRESQQAERLSSRQRQQATRTSAEPRSRPAADSIDDSAVAEEWRKGALPHDDKREEATGDESRRLDAAAGSRGYSTDREAAARANGSAPILEDGNSCAGSVAIWGSARGGAFSKGGLRPKNVRWAASVGDMVLRTRQKTATLCVVALARISGHAMLGEGGFSRRRGCGG